MTNKPADSQPPNDLAYGCALCVVALAIVGGISFLASLTRGFFPVLFLLLWGVWKVVRRWPEMRSPLVFAFGVLIVLLAAGELILQLEIHHVGSRPMFVGVTVVTLATIAMLFRWVVLRSSELAATAPTKDPPDAGEPR